MATKFDFTPGVYRVESIRLNIRGTPDSSNEGNVVKDGTGAPYRLTVGKEVPVYDVTFDHKGWAWGVITPTGAPQHHYICLWNINTVFAKRLGPLWTDTNTRPSLEARVDEVEKRLERLEKIAGL